MNDADKLQNIRGLVDAMVSITPHEATCELNRAMQPYMLQFSNYIPESETWVTDDASKTVKLIFR